MLINIIFALNVTFSTSKLEKFANDFKRCLKEMGPIRAKLFNKRLTDLDDAESLEDVRHLPGKYHELTGNRKGQWSCDLDQPYRLIFRPCTSPIPINENGQYIWLEIVDVEIIEIVDYH